MDGDSTGESRRPEDDSILSLEQLRGLQLGVAATIMPVSGGWRVRYFSIPNFEHEPGTTFPSFEAAMDAVASLLPAVNSPDERTRANDELRQRLRHSPCEAPGGEAP